MLPNTVITITPDGNSKIEAMEKSDMCHKLTEMGNKVGKVSREDPKDHPPVTQSIHQSR